jgi:hypothetical protein
MWGLVLTRGLQRLSEWRESWRQPAGRHRMGKPMPASRQHAA